MKNNIVKNIAKELDIAFIDLEPFGFAENGLRKNYYRNPVENAVLMSRKISA